MRTAPATLPLSFVPNRGQLDSRVAFAVDGRNASAFFTRRGVRYRLDGRVVAVDFVGARPTRPAARARLPGIVSYFRGPRSQWHTGIPTYRGIVYRGLWPGIDLAWSGEQGRLKYTLLVHPGADPAAVRLRYRGAHLRLERGALVVGNRREGRPVGNAGLAYTLRGDVVGFRVHGWDRTRMLVIDPPAFLYAGFLGGAGGETGFAIAADSSGNAYVTGETGSSEATFPVTVGPDLTYNGSADDAFVAKVNAAGTALVYAGYIGGDGVDGGLGIAVDSAGKAYVSGDTSSDEVTFPVTVGPDLTYNGGLKDAFVAKLNAAGTALEYAGYIGGSGIDDNFGIAVDASGGAYVTGNTDSDESTFPVTVGPDLSYNGGRDDAYVAKVDTTGTALVYAGYVGGDMDERAYGIAVDSAEHAYLTGSTGSDESTFPVAVGPDLIYNGGASDAYVALVNADGASLGYAGYVGGAADDAGFDVAVDTSGNAYLSGGTDSTESTFPVAVGPDLTYNGAGDGFVAEVSAGGAGLAYAGYVGGAASDDTYGIALDGSGNAYVTGTTSSTEATFPVLAGPDVTFNGITDGYVAKVKPGGIALDYAGYVGGSGAEFANGIAADPAGNAYLTGVTVSTDFPTIVGPDLSPNGGSDAYVAKIAVLPAFRPPVLTRFTPPSGCPGTNATIVGTAFIGATGVWFHNMEASSFTVKSDKVIRATVAPGTTSGPIAVTTKDRGTGASAKSFTINPPRPKSLKPRKGPVGTAVTINGSCFSGATAVTFGYTPAASYIVKSDKQITAVVAAKTTTSKVSVTTPSGTGTSSATFVVTP